MENFKNNVVNSFRAVKRDMNVLREQLRKQTEAINKLHKNQQFLLSHIEAIKNAPAPQPMYVGATTTMKLHDDNCPFGKQVHEENKVFFSSKEDAFTKGYKACSCLKE